MLDSKLTPKFAVIRNWRVLMCHNRVKNFIKPNSNFIFLHNQKFEKKIGRNPKCDRDRIKKNRKQNIYKKETTI